MNYPSGGSRNEPQIDKISREQLDSMSTAELLELLEQINDGMTEDNFDEDLITACLDALDKKSPLPDHPSTEESWQSFKEKVEVMETALNANADKPAKRPKRAGKRIFRTGLIAAIVVVCLFSCMVVAQASGIDVFGSIARWTGDVLGFGDRDLEPTTSVTDYDADEIIAQIENWIPDVGDDFEVSEPEIVKDSDSGILYYSQLYSSGNNYISFEARYQQNNSTSALFEKDKNDAEKMILNDVLIYFYTNMDTSVATWCINNIEFNVMADLHINELKQIFESLFGEV